MPKPGILFHIFRQQIHKLVCSYLILFSTESPHPAGLATNTTDFHSVQAATNPAELSSPRTPTVGWIPTT